MNSGLTIIQAKILSGAALSNVLDLRESVILAVRIPSSWTAADITFAASDANVADVGTATYDPVYDAAGTEMDLTVAGASRWIAVAPDATRGLLYVKLRSGTSALPVNQAADRILELAVARLA